MSKVEINDELIGRLVTLKDGTKTRINGTNTRGYTVEDRRTQVLAARLIKKGKSLFEVDKMSARDFEDSGEGYAEITNKEVKRKVMADISGGKKSSSKKSKDKTKSKDKKSSSKDKKSSSKDKKSSSKDKKSSSKDKKSKDKTKSKDKKSSSKAKTSEKPKTLIPLNTLADDNGEVGNAFAQHMERSAVEFFSAYDLPGELAFDLNLTVFQELNDDNVAATAELSIAFDVPEFEFNDEVLDLVEPKRFESEKVRKFLFDNFNSGDEFEIGATFIDPDGSELTFAGVNVEDKKLNLIFQYGDDALVYGKSEAVKKLTLALDESADDWEEEGSESDLDDAELVDGTDIEDSYDIEAFAGADADEIQEALLENYSTDQMVGLFNENFETSSNREKRVLKSGDDEAIAELVAASIFSALNGDMSEEYDSDIDSGDEAGDEGLEEFSEEDGSEEDGSEEDGSEEDGSEEDGSEEDDQVLEDGRILLDEEVDLDDMDAIADLLAGKLRPSEILRKTEEELVALFQTIYAQPSEVEFASDDEVEAEEIDMDQVFDYLITQDIVTISELRKLSEEDALKLYEEATEGFEGSESEAEEFSEEDGSEEDGSEEDGSEESGSEEDESFDDIDDLEL